MGPRKTSSRIGKRKRSPETPDSYDTFIAAIVGAIRSIPRGKTASYGEVAALAGNPRGARQVARALHALSEKLALPWHRVINAKGCISLPMEGSGALQARLLKAEGLAVDAHGRVTARGRERKRPGRPG